MNQSMFQDTLFVRLADVKWYDPDLADTIILEWLRVEPYLRQAVQLLVKEIAPEFLKDQDQNDREFAIAWEGIERIDRLRDLRSAKACLSAPHSCIAAPLRAMHLRFSHYICHA